MRKYLIALLALFWLLPTAAIAVTNPQSGQINVNGVVASQPPTQAAVITEPVNGQHFNVAQIQVSGTCQAGMLIKIFSNNIFVGSAPCSGSGTFSLQITLLEGSNTLVAKTFDALNQAGPDSQPVNVFYDVVVPAGAASAHPGVQQMILVTDSVYRGSFANEKLKLPLEILGGKGPYAVSIDWGDGTSELLVRLSAGPFSVEHLYSEGGTFVIKVTAKDVDGQVASIQTTAIVNGEGLLQGESGVIKPPENLLGAMIAGIIILVIVFLAGVAVGFRLYRDDQPVKKA